jgi:chorismate mutase
MAQVNGEPLESFLRQAMGKHDLPAIDSSWGSALLQAARRATAMAQPARRILQRDPTVIARGKQRAFTSVPYVCAQAMHAPGSLMTDSPGPAGKLQVLCVYVADSEFEQVVIAVRSLVGGPTLCMELLIVADVETEAHKDECERLQVTQAQTLAPDQPSADETLHAVQQALTSKSYDCLLYLRRKHVSAGQYNLMVSRLKPAAQDIFTSVIDYADQVAVHDTWFTENELRILSEIVGMRILVFGSTRPSNTWHITQQYEPTCTANCVLPFNPWGHGAIGLTHHDDHSSENPSGLL